MGEYGGGGGSNKKDPKPLPAGFGRSRRPREGAGEYVTVRGGSSPGSSPDPVQPNPPAAPPHAAPPAAPVVPPQSPPPGARAPQFRAPTPAPIHAPTPPVTPSPSPGGPAAPPGPAASPTPAPRSGSGLLQKLGGFGQAVRNAVDAPPQRAPSAARRAPASAPTQGTPVELPRDLLPFLRGGTIFGECEAEISEEVSKQLSAFQFAQGAPIVHASAAASEVWVLYEGRARVAQVNASSGEQTLVEHVQRGDIFGEVGALLRGGQPHAVTAEDACIALRLDTSVLEDVSRRSGGLATALARRVARRVVQLGLAGLVKGPTSVPAPSAPRPSMPSGVIPFYTVAEMNPTPDVLRMVPMNAISTHQVLPLRMNGQTLILGMVNPKNTAAIAELKRALQSVDLEIAAISIDDYANALTRFKLEASKVAAQQMGRGIQPETLQYDIKDSERDPEKKVRVIGDEVIRMVNRIIAGGLDRDASDIHIEPDASGVLVRYRVGGDLKTWDELIPMSMARGIIGRLKVLSGLDITERRLPQDGRIGISVGPREIDLRISTMPAARGEKAVMRINEAASLLRPLEQTFLEPTILGAVREALALPAGAIVVAGSTGSGKSSSLYSMINERMKVRPGTSVVMVEDPIEYRLKGATQVQVNDRIGLGFAEVLRAMMRQDGDVIAVGETRDRATAHLALEAAITGHLLMTSIHASGAMSTLQRLESFECSRSAIAQAVSVVLVQRLLPRLCQSCVRAEAPPPLLLSSLRREGIVAPGVEASIPNAVGCASCNGTGYKGRVAVVEMLRNSDDTRSALSADTSYTEVEAMAEQSGTLIRFATCAGLLLAQNQISGADALMAVAK